MKISIGIPVFNAERTIGRAIASVLAQDHADFELIVSDNASTDGTAAICRAFAAGDRRIKYVRQPVNRGPLTNFLYVLEAGTGELFAWMAADDWWSADFLRLNADFLASHPSYVGSISPTRFSGGQTSTVPLGDDVLDHPTYGYRAVSFLRRSHANSVFYGLLRRDLLRDAMYPIEWYLGFDWTIMLRLARHGPIKRLARGELVRGAGGISSNADIHARCRSRLIHWLIPFADLTRAVLPLTKGERAADRAQVALSLLKHNVIGCRDQFRYEWDKRRRSEHRAAS